MAATNSIKLCPCGCQQYTRSLQKLHPIEWRTWRHMFDRCTRKNSPDWPRYGGRGITVCERWRVFANFLADMHSRPSSEHSIDRVNNDGNYEPGNCRWATLQQQRKNQTYPGNKHIGVARRFFEVNGRSMSTKEVIAILGISESAFYKRLKKWPLDRVLAETPRPQRGLNPYQR